MKVTYAKNASKLHRAVGEILTCSPWKGFRSEQEVLVSDLFPSWEYGSERYDWVIHDLSLIIECHGKQHYEVATFGQEVSNAIMNFQAQQSRDSKKEEIAGLHNWTYIIIPYTDEKKLDSSYLMELFNENKVSEPAKVEENIKPFGSKTSDQWEEYYAARKARARLARRQNYERQKAYKEKLKR